MSRRFWSFAGLPGAAFAIRLKWGIAVGGASEKALLGWASTFGPLADMARLELQRRARLDA